MNYWRMCCVGNTHWLAHNSTSFGGKFYCPQHLRDLFKDFDPCPRQAEVQYGQREGDHTVRKIDGGWPTADAPYDVLQRDEDYILIRPVGMPEGEHSWTSIHNVYPHLPRHDNMSKRCGK